MAIINSYVTFAFIVFTLFLYGIYNFITKYEANRCDMTFMYEYPQFVKIQMPPIIDKEFPKYSLYGYGEGKFTEKLRKMQFYGIPVLFIPGNSGSYKQVRSLASISLRKSLNSHLPYHFDYFTIDFHEEYSALFGGFIDEQCKFVHQSILKILQLYKTGPNSPTSVIVIGHSMGGIVARKLFLEPGFEPSLVRIIITLSTPHMQPVLTLDPYLKEIYQEINKQWVNEDFIHNNLSHVTIAAIGGGFRDMQVRSGITPIVGENSFNLLTTNIPDVWLSTDHQCAVWCKQLMLVIVRVLFDSIDLTTKQITTQTSHLRTVFRYHFQHRSAGKKLSTSFHPKSLHLDNSQGKWFEYIQRQYTVMEPKGVQRPSHWMIRIVDDPKHEILAIETVNVNTRDWLFACNAHTLNHAGKVCEVGENLSHEGIILPSRRHQRKHVRLDLRPFRGHFTHIVIRVSPTDEPIQMNIDVFGESTGERTLRATLPRWYQFSLQHPVVNRTNEHMVNWDVTIPGFDRVWQSMLFHLNPVGTCHRKEWHSVASFHTPWDGDIEHAIFTESTGSTMSFRLHSPRPIGFNSSQHTRVRLVLDPSCQYIVKIQSSFPDILGNLIRFYGPMLLAHTAAVVLLTLSYQMSRIATDGSCPMFHSALAEGAKPYFVLPVVKIVAKLLSGKDALVWLPVPDWVSVGEENLDFFMLPLIVHTVAFGFTYILGIALWIAIIFSGQTAHKMTLKFITRIFTGIFSISEWVMVAVNKVPSAIAALLVAISLQTCGALGICLGACYFFLKMSNMYEDYLDDLYKYVIKIFTKIILNRKTKEEIEREQAREQARKERKERAAKRKLKKQEDKKSEKNNKVNTDGKIDETHEDTKNEKEIEDKTEQLKNSNSEKGEIEIEVKNKENAIHNESPTVSDEDEFDLEETLEDLLREHIREAKEEEERERREKEAAENHDFSSSEIHFNFTLFLLWLIAGVQTLPTLLVWAHNYSFKTQLKPDPTIVPTLLLCCSAGILWQSSPPKINIKYYRAMNCILNGYAITILVYGVRTLYHVTNIVSLAFATIALHQFLGVDRGPRPAAPPKPRSLIDEIQELYNSEIKRKNEALMEESSNIEEIRDKPDEPKNLEVNEVEEKEDETI